jgi:hypothetical protein
MAKATMTPDELERLADAVAAGALSAPQFAARIAKLPAAKVQALNALIEQKQAEAASDRAFVPPQTIAIPAKIADDLRDAVSYRLGRRQQDVPEIETERPALQALKDAIGEPVVLVDCEHTAAIVDALEPWIAFQAEKVEVARVGGESRARQQYRVAELDRLRTFVATLAERNNEKESE